MDINTLPTSQAIDINIPLAFEELFAKNKYRYKIYHGGRGGGKTVTFGIALLLLAMKKPIRILCVREIQRSIKDSVHKNIVDLIGSFQDEHKGIWNYWESTLTSIRFKNGSEFIFCGLSGNAQQIKSMANIDICWCFVAGTLIDGIKIEDIKAGDFVSSFNHFTGKIEKQEVLRVMKRKAPKQLYKLLTYNGTKSIIGTSEHPIYVKNKGYVPLSKVIIGDIIYAKIKYTRNGRVFRKMWNDDTNGHTWSSSKVCKSRWSILSRLYKKEVIGKNDEKQSYGQSRITKENDKEIESNGTQTNCSWWKRKRVHKSSKNLNKKVRKRMVDRVYSSNGSLSGREQFANPLQSRYCKCVLWNSYRTRRKKPLWEDSTRRRLKKRYFLTEQRVDSVKVQESRDIEKLRLSDGGNYVYNLEVKGNNNYFANGLLVHNCEEAQTISNSSLNVLIPTIRNEGSEIWFSFNRLTENDPVFEYFCVNPDDRTYVRQVNYDENPYFPQVLEEERLRALRNLATEDYDHIWLGHPKNFLNESYFGQYVRKAEQEHRICRGVLDTTIKVHTVWDLGVSDATAIWFFQLYGTEIRLIDYYEDSGEGLQFYIDVLADKKYRYGKHFAPPDIAVREFSTGQSRLETAHRLGLDFNVLLPSNVNEGIHLVRTNFHRCFFDSDNTQVGLKSLKNYRKEFDEKHQIFKDKPLHDWTSHGADAFRYLMQAVSYISPISGYYKSNSEFDEDYERECVRFDDKYNKITGY